MMRHRSKPVHLVVDGLPAHKTALVKTYVASTDGMLTLHFLRKRESNSTFPDAGVTAMLGSMIEMGGRGDGRGVVRGS
jgi:hypothetical protein